MRRELKPNVCEKPKGSGRYYYRMTWRDSEGKRKERYIPLPPFGTPEHDVEYWKARSGKSTVRTIKTSWDALATSYFASNKFLKLKPASKKTYRRYISQLLEKNGPRDVLATRRSHVLAIHEKYADTPRKADHLVQAIAVLFRRAIELEWTNHSPTQGIELFGPSNPFEPWPEPLQAAFRKAADPVTLTAYQLGTGTGQRAGDLVKMEWAHFDGEYMMVTQEKTEERLAVYCPLRLREYLASLPRSGKFILAKNLTEHLSYDAIEKRFRHVRNQLDTQHRLTMHGWRYTAAVELAEAGCSDAEIQAVTGHKTLEMVQKYRSRARQKRLSKSAQNKRT